MTIADHSRTLFASSIKIKFRGMLYNKHVINDQDSKYHTIILKKNLLLSVGEETASTKVKDSGSVSGMARRVETARTIYFESSYMVWCGGNDGQFGNIFVFEIELITERTKTLLM